VRGEVIRGAYTAIDLLPGSAKGTLKGSSIVHAGESTLKAGESRLVGRDLKEAGSIGPDGQGGKVKRKAFQNGKTGASFFQTAKEQGNRIDVGIKEGGQRSVYSQPLRTQ